MSEFSSILSKYVHEKNIKTYSLAQYCGLDRSNMYKIINGKRKPASLNMVRKMAQFMQLSPEEKHDLEEAYAITLEGPENYYRRKEVLEFFRDFTLSAAPLPPFHYNARIEEEEKIFLNSSIEVMQTFFHMISSEMSSGTHGHLRLLVQPDAAFLVNLTSAECQRDAGIRIEHIFCLDSHSHSGQSKKNYNLNCLKQILPLYGSCRNYEAYYYYDDISSRTGSLTLLPYMIVTSRCVCLLTAGLNKGCVLHSRESIRMFSDIFDEYLQESTPLLNQITDVQDQLNYAARLLQESITGYSFQMSPCFTPFITFAQVEKYVRKDIPGRELFIAHFQEYVKKTLTLCSQSKITSIFSYDGVRRFLESGRIDEYPQDVCLPFDPPDRAALVKKLIPVCKTGAFRMLHKDIGSSLYELYLFVNTKNGYLMFPSPYSRHPVYLNIEEPGLLYAFYDFCENLDESLFCTPKEAESLLTELIQDF